MKKMLFNASRLFKTDGSQHKEMGHEKGKNLEVWPVAALYRRPLLGGGARMLTLAFAKSSPLRNRGGDAAGVGTDARGAGYPRVQESAADIGAFEYKPDSRGTLIRIE